MRKHADGVRFGEVGALHHGMAQHQATIPCQIDIDHLDVGIDVPDVVLPRQFTANTTIAAFIMNSIYLDAGTFLRIIMQMEHSQFSHQPRAEELTDEAFVAVVCPSVAQYRHYVTGPGNVRKPLAILVVRTGYDALDGLHHRGAERIGMKTRKSRLVEIRLKHDVEVRLHEFDKMAV